VQRELSLGADEAVAAIETIRLELARRRLTAVIAVADAHGELVALLRGDGAPYSSVGIATNKAWTAARLRRPTSVFAKRLASRQMSRDVFADRRFVNEPGGLPVYSKGAWLGAVAVSGTSTMDGLALQTDDDDESLASVAVLPLTDPYPPSIWNEFESAGPPGGAQAPR
jgi:glc operon protein GlcG